MNEKLGELVGVGSGDSSGVAPGEGTSDGIDGDVSAGQGRPGVMSDFGLFCGLYLGHDIMLAARICCLKRSAHNLRSRCAHSHVEFTLLW